MITCQYCGASYQKFQNICSSCGARLLKNGKMGNKKGTTQLTDERIRQICAAYEDAKEFRPLSALSEKKLKAAKKTFKVFPSEESIYLFCDTHPLDKGKRGFILCQDGIYWHNNWANETNRNYLAWEDFAERKLRLKGFAVDLGRGDSIGLAGLGSDIKRDKALRLLFEIQSALKE